MPMKPKRPCSYPGCPNLTDGRYCPEHQQKVNSNYEKYGRDPATKKRYGKAWKRIRDKYAAEHPFCELCFECGIIVEIQEIHHKKPLSEGGTHDRSNLIALCKSCHSRIHAHPYDSGEEIYKLSLTIHNSTGEIWERKVFIGHLLKMSILIDFHQQK